MTYEFVNEASVVIVGGGCMGASIAFHLAKAGLQDIVLLEKDRIGWGATGKSTGIIRQHYGTEVVTKMALESLRFFERFDELVGWPCGFARTGFLALAGPYDEDALRKNFEMHRRVGVKAALLSPREVKEKFPDLYTDDLALASYEPESGYADPMETTRSFVTSAKSLGVRVMERTKLLDIDVRGGKVSKAVTDRGEIVTGKVVVAANVWAKAIFAKVGIDLPIVPLKEQNGFFSRPERFRSAIPVCADMINAIYFRPDGVDRIVVGSLDPNLPLIADVDNYGEGIEPQMLSAYAERLIKRCPVMAMGHASGGLTGPYDVTPDWHPILDEMEQVEGLYCAAGFSGHGFKLCPSVGRMMAELILKGRRPEELEFFRFDRFELGKLLKGKYRYSIIA